MVWAYVWAVMFAGKRRRNLIMPLVLMLGIIPDIDLFLHGFGVLHHTFGDFLVGNVMIFWPFSQSYFGFNFTMLSILDVALEITGLSLAAGISYFNGDLRRLLSVDIHNILMFLPLFALLTSMLFFAVDWPIVPLIAYVLSRKLFTTIVLGHIILVVFLALSILQGLRKLFKYEKHE
jgi:hypothetical protein